MMRRIPLEPVIKGALIVAIGFVVFTVVSLQRANQQVLIHLKEQQDYSDKAVADLKADNAQQTVILCTLILSQSKANDGLSTDDISKIEDICKQKIKQTGADITPANQASGPAQSSGIQSSSASSSLPHNTPNSTTSMPDNSQGGNDNSHNPKPTPKPNPDQGIIPDNVPLIGKLL